MTIKVALAASPYEAELLEHAFRRQGCAPAADDEAAVVWDKARSIPWLDVLRGAICCNALPAITLTRKAALAELVAAHVAQQPASCLASAVPRTLILHDDDDPKAALAQARRTLLEGASADEMYVLKHSERDRGQGMAFLRSSLQSADELANHVANRPGPWVLQAYVKDPLLVRGHKCHLRVHVVVAGCYQVWIAEEHTLVLPAVRAYGDASAHPASLLVHATNHAFQKRAGAPEAALSSSLTLAEACELWAGRRGGGCAADTPHSHALAPSRGQVHARLSAAIRHVTKELFAAAVSTQGQPLALYPLQNCAQLLGLDFLVDRSLQVHLLEVNSDPALSIFGERLKPHCTALLEGVAALVRGMAVDFLQLQLQRRDSELAAPGSFQLQQGAVEPQNELASNQQQNCFTKVLEMSLPGSFEERSRRIRAALNVSGRLTAASFQPPPAPSPRLVSDERVLEHCNSATSASRESPAPHACHAERDTRCNGKTKQAGRDDQSTSTSGACSVDTNRSSSPGTRATCFAEDGAGGAQSTDGVGQQPAGRRCVVGIARCEPGAAAMESVARAHGADVSYSLRDASVTLMFASRQDMPWDRVLDGKLLGSHHLKSAVFQGTAKSMVALYMAVLKQFGPAEAAELMAPAVVVSAKAALPDSTENEALLDILQRGRCWAMARIDAASTLALDLKDLLRPAPLDPPQVLAELEAMAREDAQNKVFLQRMPPHVNPRTYTLSVVTASVGQHLLLWQRAALCTAAGGSNSDSIGRLSAEQRQAVQHVLRQVFDAARASKGFWPVDWTFEAVVCRFRFCGCQQVAVQPPSTSTVASSMSDSSSCRLPCQLMHVLPLSKVAMRKEVSDAVNKFADVAHMGYAELIGRLYLSGPNPVAGPGGLGKDRRSMMSKDTWLSQQEWVPTE